MRPRRFDVVTVVARSAVDRLLGTEGDLQGRLRILRRLRAKGLLIPDPRGGRLTHRVRTGQLNSVDDLSGALLHAASE